jgi:hypothetical protein
MDDEPCAGGGVSGTVNGDVGGTAVAAPADEPSPPIPELPIFPTPDDPMPPMPDVGLAPIADVDPALDPTVIPEVDGPLVVDGGCRVPSVGAEPIAAMSGTAGAAGGTDLDDPMPG